MSSNGNGNSNNSTNEINRLFERNNGSAKRFKPTSKETSLKTRIFEQKRFFKWLCYEPVWKTDLLANPGQLIFSAVLASNFLLRVETGLHQIYQESVHSFFSVKVFDVEKKMELKQISKVIFRDDFFDSHQEKPALVKFVDTLPLYFAVRPTCPHCASPMNLINPLKASQMPFWAHTVLFKQTEGQSKPPTCLYKQAIWGDFPNIRERRPENRPENRPANKQKFGRGESGQNKFKDNNG